MPFPHSNCRLQRLNEFCNDELLYCNYMKMSMAKKNRKNLTVLIKRFSKDNFTFDLYKHDFK